MSCYEWERGTFKLSVKEYQKFKKEFRRRWNASMDEAYDNACRVQSGVVAAHKGERNVHWWDAVRDHQMMTAGTDFWSRRAVSTVHDLDHAQLILKSIGLKLGGGMGTRPIKPKKKDFPHATSKVTSFSDGWGDADVEFRDDCRCVVWHVGENNHACERARRSVVGKIFFDLLGKVEWTRGTGGQIVGNDEYSRDSYDEGGGGNYTKGTWGPKEQKAQRATEARAGWAPVAGFSWRSAGW